MTAAIMAGCNERVYPTGKVRHEFGKNCAIDKYFGTHVRNHIYLIKSYFFVHMLPIYLTILKCPFLVKKNCLKHGHFSCRVTPTALFI